jgi:hypothetical protein
MILSDKKKRGEKATRRRGEKRRQKEEGRKGDKTRLMASGVAKLLPFTCQEITAQLT